MRKLQSGEITRMKTTASESLNDTCSVHTPTFQTNTLGERTVFSWSTSANVECGFTTKLPYKTYRGDIVTLDADGVLRLPLTYSININNEITCRNKRYKVDGITAGLTVWIITLKRVDLNSS